MCIFNHRPITFRLYKCFVLCLAVRPFLGLVSRRILLLHVYLVFPSRLDSALWCCLVLQGEFQHLVYFIALDYHPFSNMESIKGLDLWGSINFSVRASCSRFTTQIPWISFLLLPYFSVVRSSGGFVGLLLVILFPVLGDSLELSGGMSYHCKGCPK